MPVVFISHGAPSVALEDDDFTRALRQFGETLIEARAFVVVSAHWQTRGGMRVNAVERPEPIYDFGGFSPELYTLHYDAPGSPQLAERIAQLLRDSGIDARLETSRGWDHGVWVPLLHLAPGASVPIVELSLPVPATPDQLMRTGKALRPLREEEIVLIGTGGIVHNLGMLRFDDKEAPADAWARAFDEWVSERLSKHDFASIAAYRDSAPHAGIAVPTPEHFEPLFVVLGATSEEDHLTPIYAGFHYGSLSMRTFAFDGGNIR